MSRVYPWLLSALSTALLIPGPPLVQPADALAAAALICLSNVEQTKLVERGKIIPLQTIIHSRKVQKRGRVVKVKLCKDRKRYFYQITTISDAGRIRNLIVRAKPKVVKVRLQPVDGCYFNGHKWRVGSICKYQCAKGTCPRQFCKSNGDWVPLAPCSRNANCRNYSDCASR
jgi:hypothetical protein